MTIKSVLLFTLVVKMMYLFSGVSMATEFMAATPKNFKLPTAESEYDKNLLKELEEINWNNVHIGAEGNLPAFAFTIGHFYKSNHPEIIVIGLKPETAHQLLNIAAVKIAGAKERIQPYKKYTDLTEGLSLMFIPVNIEHYGEYLGYANWFYGSLSKPYPVLQMVWPDKAGLYPWDKGFEQRFLQIQPIIGKKP